MINHPDLFEEAKHYEKTTGEERFTWSQGESLEELQRPERIAEIEAEHARRLEMAQHGSHSQSLLNVFSETIEPWQNDIGCTICEI